MTTSTTSRLAIAPNPLRLFASPTPWLALCYLASYILTSGILFAVTLATTVAAGVLGLAGIGLPLLIGAAFIVRRLAGFERLRLGLTQSGMEAANYVPVADSGFFGCLKRLWTDPATWRNIAYLLFLWPFLFAFNVAAFAIWMSFAALISLPFWYWAIPQSFPNGETANGVAFGYFPDGPGAPPRGIGLWVHDLPSSLLAAGIGCALVLLVGNYLVAGAARIHAAAARALIGGYRDPLAAAREVLARPGPLSAAAA